MRSIDERWSRLQAVRQANFAKASAAPDLDAAHEALLLQESFRELIRSAAVKGRNADFMDRLHHAESASGRLHALLKENPVAWDAARRKTANDLFDAVKSDCTACHRTYRN